MRKVAIKTNDQSTNFVWHAVRFGEEYVRKKIAWNSIITLTKSRLLLDFQHDELQVLPFFVFGLVLSKMPHTIQLNNIFL